MKNIDNELHILNYQLYMLLFNSIPFNFIADQLAMASIIGIVAGVVVLIAIIAIVVVLVLKKKRTNGKSPKHTVNSGPM